MILDPKQFKLVSKICENAYIIEEIKTNKKYAALFLLKADGYEYYSADQYYKFFMNKINILSQVDCPAILSLKGLVRGNFNFEISKLCHESPSIVTDLMPNKLLTNLKSLSGTTRYIILLGTALGMKYLHSKGILHLSLCPNYILLDENFYPHISGFSKSVKTDKPLESFSVCLNLKKNEDSDCPCNYNDLFNPFLSSDQNFPCTYKTDVFSFSLIAYYICSAKYPFSASKSFFTSLRSLLKGCRPSCTSIDDPIRYLIEKCWSNDESERPNFDFIVNRLMQDDIIDSFSADRTKVSEYLSNFPLYLFSISPFKANLKVKKEDEKEKVFSPSNLPEIDLLTEEEICNLRMIRRLGKGGMSEVHEVGREEKYALKIIDSEQINTSNLRRLLNEYEIINKLRHPNVIKAFGFFYGSKKSDGPSPSILLELCSTNLLSEVKKLTNVQIVSIVYEIVEGMKFIHSKGFIHRDLKPSNILLTFNGHVKITDFGISQIVSLETQTTFSGTQKFMAPELLNEEKHFSEKVDVYSFGVLLFTVLNKGEMPKITVVQVGNGKMAPIPSSVNDFASKLIKSCWSFKPEERPSFDDISKLLRKENFKLVNLNENEMVEIKKFVNDHDNEIKAFAP